MDIKAALDKAFEDQVAQMFGIFAASVAGASDIESELIAAGERFRKGVALSKIVLTRAKEISVA
ncbi:MAG: hypothetical protein L7F78_06595 [Syntrophales bacterium LBB04]|nr:hypothetical protein [Syntrophales bacterium LBB04]